MVERDGGRVLAADLAGITELERRLWLVVREQRQPVGVMRPELCAACGTPRVAYFRWCQTCGRDFESDRERPADSVRADAFAITAPKPTPGPTVAVRRPTPLPGPTFALTPPAGPATGTAVASQPAMEAPGYSTNGRHTGPVERLPTPRLPLPRPVAPPPGRIARAVDGLRDSDWFDAQRLAFGAIVGLAIGVIVTLLLLAMQ